MIGEFMWEEECKSFFESLWNGQVKDAPQRIFKIQEEKVFETLSFYLRESERSVNDNFIEQLKDGVNFERGFCRSQGEPKNGKLVVFCNPKNVSEQKQ
ncbi:hypothetical protein [Mycoplasma suis]|uniref:Uncharacterized protein n=1 Tax=Mycoplasma suis (strain Illinois) TaxID=768700 RepID=F0QQ96_MYCSL|nr:hypothetical protein [Mycoplasma suis]ADX97666.1 hypothetical protein MSU_0122 [Mycoplasma suis str. Illinois]